LGGEGEVVDDWVSECYLLRNSVAHEGLVPGDTQARAAVRATILLGAEIAQVLRSQARFRRLGALLALRRTSKRGALRNNTQQRKTIDPLQILRLPDPPIHALQQEGDPQAEQQTQHPAKGSVPAWPDLRDQREASDADTAGLDDHDAAVCEVTLNRREIRE
jgi:hypothetical protein